MSRQWLIAGKRFDSTADLKNYVENMLSRYNHGAYLSLWDAQFILGLLKHHPDAEEKMAGIIAGVLVHRRDGGKGFTLHKESGELVTFSWQKCIAPPSPWTKFTRVCRKLVQPDIQLAKKKIFAETPYLKCPFTGEILTEKSCHLDHEQPFTFSVIVKNFAQEWGIVAENVIYVHGDGFTTFRDAQLAQDWIAYHRLYARLRPVSATANLSIIPKLNREEKNA